MDKFQDVSCFCFCQGNKIDSSRKRRLTLLVERMVLTFLKLGVYDNTFLQAASTLVTEYLSAGFRSAMQLLQPCCSTLLEDMYSAFITVFGP